MNSTLVLELNDDVIRTDFSIYSSDPRLVPQNISLTRNDSNARITELRDHLIRADMSAYERLKKDSGIDFRPPTLRTS